MRRFREFGEICHGVFVDLVIESKHRKSASNSEISLVILLAELQVFWVDLLQEVPVRLTRSIDTVSQDKVEESNT